MRFELRSSSSRREGFLDIPLIPQSAHTGSVIRADVHVAPDGRPKGSGIVAFETAEDARNAIQQFNGYDWQGRNLEVREDRFAAAAPGGFGGRGGFGGGAGGFGGAPAPGYDAGAASNPPNPFTDFATSGGEPSAIIYVRNVSTPYIPLAAAC